MASAWESRFGEFVRRVMALHENTALDVLPDLMPVLPVLDPAQPELALLRRERLCAGHAVSGATALVFSVVSVGNDIGSLGQLVVVDEVTNQSAIEVTWGVLTGTGGGTSLPTKCYTDTRGSSPLVGLSRPALARVGFTTLGVAAQNGGRILPGQTVRPRAVLIPDSALLVVGQVVNTEVRASFLWRERAPTEEEFAPTGA